MGAGLRGAIGPSCSPVELADQHEPAMVCGIEMAGEGADLGGEFVDGAHGGLDLGW
jgi:hypothetical protein